VAQTEKTKINLKNVNDMGQQTGKMGSKDKMQQQWTDRRQ
jgi:hypothetical protein